MAPAIKRGLSLAYFLQAAFANSTAFVLIFLTLSSNPYSPSTKLVPPNVLVSIISAPASR